MKIAFATKLRLPEERGVSFFIVAMCQALKENSHEIELVCPARKQNANFANVDFWKYYQLKRNVFKVKKLYCFEAPKVYGLELIFSRLRYLLMSWTYSLALMAFLYQTSQPVVYLFNECKEALWLLKLFSPFYRPVVVYEVHVPPTGIYERFLEKNSLGRVDLLVVITQFSARAYKEMGVSASKISIFPSAVDLASFDYATPINRLKHKLRIPGKTFNIGFGGRFTTNGQEKGIADLIEAVAVLTRKYHNLLLVCVGGPQQYIDKYTLLAKHCGLLANQFLFLDHVTPQILHAYMRIFDICVMPFPHTNHYANNMSPLKMFEYMASKNPLVATDLPSVREVLKDGKNALLVQPGSPTDLACGIEKLIKNRRLAKRLAKAAFFEVTAKYTMKRRAEVISAAIAMQYNDRYPAK